MKVLLMILMLNSTTVLAASLNMKPGLWQVDMKMNMDGKEYDPMAEMNKHLKGMSKEQRAVMMKQMGGGAHTKSLAERKVCYSEKMINDPQKLNKEHKSDCDYKTTSSSSNKVLAHYTCKDGAKGDIAWQAKDPRNLTMNMNSIDKNGKKMQMNYSAKFIDSNCGDLKPLVE